MQIVLYTFLCSLTLLFAGSAHGATPIDPYEAALAEEERTTVFCYALREERALCERLRVARALVSTVSLKTYTHEERVGKKRVSVPYREFSLVAYDPVEDEYHDILLGMPVDVTKRGNFQPQVLTVSEPAYQVTRLRGQSLNKMVFEIRYGDRVLYAYAGKHLLFTEEKLHPLWGGRMVTLVQEVVNLATAPYLVNYEFAVAGQALFMARIRQALLELREAGVMSRAYPDRLLADTVTEMEIAKLLIAEQTDPCFLSDRPPGCARLIPVPPYPDDALVRQAVNVEFAINGLAAFRHMRSSANAGGSLQFTNNPVTRVVEVQKRSKGKGKLQKFKERRTFAGTYDAIQTLYPLAKIDPDFRRGTKSLLNLTKAAAALIDYELSNPNLPAWAKELFLLDRDFAIIIPGGAYNGGPTQATRISQLIEKFSLAQGISAPRFHDFPWEDFVLWIERPGSGLKRETLGYIKKIIQNHWHLERHRPDPTVTSERAPLGALFSFVHLISLPLGGILVPVLNQFVLRDIFLLSSLFSYAPYPS